MRRRQDRVSWRQRLRTSRKWRVLWQKPKPQFLSRPKRNPKRRQRRCRCRCGVRSRACAGRSTGCSRTSLRVRSDCPSAARRSTSSRSGRRSPGWRYRRWISSSATTPTRFTPNCPGMDEKDVEVKVAGGVLTIKGEKQQDKEEKKPDFHLRERRGSARSSVVLRVPDGVDARQDRGELQEGRADGHAAEGGRGAKACQDDRGERRITGFDRRKPPT